MDTTINKKCKRCNQEKSINDFISLTTHKETLKCSRCREIGAKQSSKFRKECPEKVMSSRKKYYISNQEIIKDKSRQFHHKNKETCNKRSAKWHVDHREMANERRSACHFANKKEFNRKCTKYYEDNKCSHNVFKTLCRVCNDHIDLTIKRIVSASMWFDKSHNIYDEDNYIDRCFVEMLIEESTRCHYCSIEMDFIGNNNTMVTIERLDNTIGHIKSNCVLACRFCNASGVGQRR